MHGKRKARGRGSRPRAKRRKKEAGGEENSEKVMGEPRPIVELAQKALGLDQLHPPDGAIMKVLEGKLASEEAMKKFFNGKGSLKELQDRSRKLKKTEKYFKKKVSAPGLAASPH
jgi:hypothetical protein